MPKNEPAKRFVYTAFTVGVGAVLTSHLDPCGDPLAESWAPACLPVIGGRSSSTVRDVVWPTPNDPVLQFDLAKTEITGRQVGRQAGHEKYETIIRKTVTNLNILNTLKADIGVEITFLYTRRPPPTRSMQRHLIDVKFNFSRPFVVTTPGVTLKPPLPKPIELDQRIPKLAGQDFKKFRRQINKLRPGAQHLKHPLGEAVLGGHGQGVIYTALAKGKAFTYKNPDFGKFDVPLTGPRVGTFEVYIGEWWGQPYWQSITFLRVEFNDVQDRRHPEGTFSGEIVIDDGDDGCPVPS